MTPAAHPVTRRTIRRAPLAAHDPLAALHHALRAEPGREGLAGQLEQLCPGLRECFWRRRGPGGLYDDLLAQAPRMAARVRALVDQQDLVLSRLSRLLGLLGRWPERAARVRSAVGELNDAVRALRCAEDHLVLDVYTCDLGGEG